MSSAFGLFVLLAAIAIATPGPGVVLTLSNALHHGFRGAFSGILGIAGGSVVVATIAAGSLSALLARSPGVFRLVRFVGAVYLIWLGVGLLRSQTVAASPGLPRRSATGRQFLAAAGLQLTNPHALAFFISVFPQFVDTQGKFWPQFTLLIGSFGVLLVVIHAAFAVIAGRLRDRTTTGWNVQFLCRLSGVAFVAYGAAALLGTQNWSVQ